MWWDAKSRVGVLPSGLPCCPHCRGVLFEMPEVQWWEGVVKHAQKQPGYETMVEWGRGRCFRKSTDLESAWKVAVARRDSDALP